MQTVSQPPEGRHFRSAPLTLVASDSTSLGATLFEPRGPARGAVVVHSATATPAGYYRRFAEFLASSGLRVLTYDYRGIGRSRPSSLSGFHATMTDWARLDARAAHGWLAAQFPGEPVAIVGHSFGGQLLGLLDEAAAASGALLVGSQLGYFGYWPQSERLKLGLVWHAVVPAIARTVGYLPGGLGLGEELPRGVAEEWALWCRTPGYLVAHHPDAVDRLASVASPVRVYSFTDDEFAPARAVNELLARLGSAKLEHRRLAPEDFDGRPIGHFGFFRDRFGATLWPEAAAFLADTLAGRRPRPASTGPWRDAELDVRRDLEWGRAS